MTFDVVTPIPGFEQIKKVELKKIDDFFMQLKSCDDATSFTLINPFLLREYDFEVPEYFKNLLDLKEQTNTLVFNIIVVAKPIENSVINFIAPLVFNVDNKTVAQVLLDSNKYKDFGIMESISSFMEKK